MDIATLLERYRAMHALSEHMLAAARAGQWERLVQLEQARSMVSSELQQHDKIAWDLQRGREKARLIRAILACDHEVGTLARGAMNELKAPLAATSMARKVGQAYKTP